MFRTLANAKLLTSLASANRVGAVSARFNCGGARALAPRNDAPTFSGAAVVNKEITNISSKDYEGKYLVFFTYPLDFTFVCPTEIIAFSDRIDEFKKLGCEVVACSCDSQHSHLAWIKTPRKEGGLGDMKIPILSDFTKKIARDFGVLDEESGVAYRALFIIDPKNKIRHTLVNDLPVGRSVDEALRTLKAFQYVEEHGDVCPANWAEGRDSIDTSSPSDYFSKNN